MIFDPTKLLLIAGPCALENEEVCNAAAETLLQLQEKYPELNILFSGSFDKANRTSLSSDRGPGLDAGIQMLQKVKDNFGFRIITDIHTIEQAERVGKVCDAVQIPAFLCRQTDLIVAAAETGKTVFVKKGQFLSPSEMKYVVNKLEQSKAKEIWQGERGTFFGYNNLVVDMRSFPVMKGHGHPVIFDATHSVQEPGGNEGSSGGKREYVKLLANAACATGCVDGLYIETHPNPEKAISDKNTQIPLSELEDMVVSCLGHWRLQKTMQCVEA